MQKKTINKKRLNKYICIISIQLDTMRNKNICKFNLNNDIPDVTNLFFCTMSLTYYTSIVRHTKKRTQRNKAGIISDRSNRN